MTPQQQNWVRGELGARIDALESAVNAITPGKTDGAGPVRKLLQTLHQSSRAVGLAEISNASAMAFSAGDAEIKGRSIGLIQMLREQVRKTQGPSSAVLLLGAEAAVLPELEKKLKVAGKYVLRAAGVKEAEMLLREKDVVFIVSDLFLPDQDVRQFIAGLRGRPLTAAMPVIVVTSKVAASEANVADLLPDVDVFFGKPVTADDVFVAMEQRLRRSHERIRAAHRDPLTGLLNRAAFGEYFERAVQQHRAVKEPIAIAVMKIDRYQQACDAFGPQTGEKMLRHFGAVLSRYFRATDVVARWSGCEFMALFPGEDNNGASRTMERIREALTREPFLFPDGTSEPLKLFAGVSVLPESGTMDLAIDQADKFMHQAQTQGPDSVVSQASEGPKRKERVVVISNSDTTSRVLNHLLTKENYEIVPYRGIEEATLKYLETAKCHLIIMDDAGHTAESLAELKKIRALPRQSRTQIVLLTAKEEIASRAIELGANDHAMKPLDLMAFVKTVRRLITRGMGDNPRDEGHESLLIISNDLHSLIILGTSLQKQTGFVIHLARGVKDGMTQLNKRRPTVTLIDIKPRTDDWKQLMDALLIVRPSPVIVVAVDEPDLHYARGIKTPPVKGVLLRPLQPLNIAEQFQTACGVKPAGASGRPEMAAILKEEIDRVMRLPPA